MKIKGIKLFATGLVALVASTAASAASFTFNLTNQGTKSASAYNDLSFTSTSGKSSLTMDVYGAHMNDTKAFGSSTLNSVSAATVAVWSGYGMGVLFGNDSTGNETHQIDNVGGGVDFVVLSFSEAVTLSGYGMTAYSLGNTSFTDNDSSFMAYSGTIVDLLGGVNKNAFSTIAGPGGTSAVKTGSSAASSIWLVGAAVASGNNDAFKLTSLSVNTVAAPVPEPATWALLIVGFGGIGMAMRRRSSPAMGVARLG